ncbi:uncharacterized protein LOC136084386 [Hydra vulgaris]|uniref:uncharacterized protein LOC136084386 n=1 Tax=Hydra vulgaris TaxID=6087 RepID=UPI0032EA8401
MDSIQDPTTREKLERKIIKPIISIKKRKVIANGIDEIWAADLVDMQAFSKFNDGIKYLLIVIDVISQYGWIVLLKTKTGVEVAHAFSKIFKDRKCTKLWVDKGLEEALGVQLYSTENKEKSCVVERWNRTMKEKIPIQPKFSIGDKVRITKKKGAFEKGYTPRWTEEVFTVSQVQCTDPPTYKITDYNGEKIQGTFYEQEL